MLPFWLGCIAGVTPWIAIGSYLVSPGNAANPPGFVYGIFISLLVFFNCFALNQWLQCRRVGEWRGHLYGETVYITLSLVAKSLLAWQVFAGTRVPPNRTGCRSRGPGQWSAKTRSAHECARPSTCTSAPWGARARGSRFGHTAVLYPPRAVPDSRTAGSVASGRPGPAPGWSGYQIHHPTPTLWRRRGPSGTLEEWLHPTAVSMAKQSYRFVLCLWESACVRFVPLL